METISGSVGETEAVPWTKFWLKYFYDNGERRKKRRENTGFP